MPFKNHKVALEYWRRRRLENPMLERKYYLANREQILVRHREYYQKHKNERRIYLQKYSEKYPKRMRARNLSKRVLIKSSCEICTSIENLIKHHPDYSKPLEIITLCQSCHMKLHSNLKRKMEE